LSAHLGEASDLQENFFFVQLGRLAFVGLLASNAFSHLVSNEFEDSLLIFESFPFVLREEFPLVDDDFSSFICAICLSEVLAERTLQH